MAQRFTGLILSQKQIYKLYNPDWYRLSVRYLEAM